MSVSKAAEENRPLPEPFWIKWAQLHQFLRAQSLAQTSVTSMDASAKASLKKPDKRDTEVASSSAKAASIEPDQRDAEVPDERHAEVASTKKQEPDKRDVKVAATQTFICQA